MTKISFNKYALLGLLCGLLAPAAQATVVVGSDLSWKQSTVTTSGGIGGDWTNPMIVPPGAGTFTQAVTAGPSAASGGAATLGVTALQSGSGVSYYRTTFDLSAFSSITALLSVSVDNDVAIWINGSFVGAEVSLAAANWEGPLPGFNIAANGSITNISKFDQTNAFTGFHAGTNDLILAVRNLDGGDGGGFGFRMSLDTVAASAPEPASLALLGVAGLLGLRRRRSV